MKHLPASISAENARAKIERGIYFRIDRLVGRAIPSFRAPLALARPLPFLEIAWMPQYMMTFALQGPRAPESVCATVDGYSAQFALFLAGNQVIDESLEGDLPEPEVTLDRAKYVAGEGLLKWVMRHHRTGKVKVGASLAVDILRYPFWVYYYQRRRGLLDVRILDAVTGDSPGSKTKYAIVRAFERTAADPV